MQFLKKSVRGLATFFYVWLIFTLAIVSAIVMTFNSPKKIEKSLNDSGVYHTFVSGALKEAEKSNRENQKNSDSNDLPISKPEVVAAANKAFTPQLLQNTTENILDGTYNWLSGKTKTPDFTIDLTNAKQTFATAVGEAAKNRVASLPVCTVAQLRSLNNQDIDPFNVPCRPAGLNLAAQQKKVTNDILNNKDFLGTPKITPANMPKDSKGKTVFEEAAKAPTVYKWINASPWLLAILAFLAGLIAFFLHESRRKAARKLAIATTVIGGILVIIYLITALIFHQLNQPTGKLGEAVKGSFQQTIIKAMDSISHSVESAILWFGITYLLLGVGTLLALHYTKPKTATTEADTKKEPTPPADDSPNQDKPKPDTKPKSTKS